MKMQKQKTYRLLTLSSATLWNGILISTMPNFQSSKIFDDEEVHRISNDQFHNLQARQSGNWGNFHQNLDNNDMIHPFMVVSLSSSLMVKSEPIGFVLEMF